MIRLRPKRRPWKKERKHAIGLRERESNGKHGRDKKEECG